MKLPTANRREAGKHLATLLEDVRDQDDVLVLGLARGGVPVAYEVALALNVPLDVYVVRKLGVPGREEMAMGAIAAGNVQVLNNSVIRAARISQGVIDATAARELQELRRRQLLYRGSQVPPDVRDRTVVLVDDGLATGSTMRAAIEALRQLRPRKVILAVPVGAASVCRSFSNIADAIVCAATPEALDAIGLWYEDFEPTSDDEVRSLLADAARRPGITPPVSGKATNGNFHRDRTSG